MSHLQKAQLFFADARNTRLVLFGLTLAGLLVSLAAPAPVAACIPLSEGGSCGG